MADNQTPGVGLDDPEILRKVAEMLEHTGWLNADIMGPVRTRLRAIADRLDSRQEAHGRFTDPPNGWYIFGTHSGWSPAPPLEFSQEKDIGGDPLFERPAPIPVPTMPS